MSWLFCFSSDSSELIFRLECMRRQVNIRYDILASAKNGNLDAFERIILRLEQPIYNFLYRMVQNESDAEDLTQETFLRLYLHIHEYDSEKNFNAWVFTIARRLAYDWLRRKQNKKDLIMLDSDKLDFEKSKHMNPDYILENITQKIDVESALSHLSHEYREVLLLYYWYGYGYAEIAEILNEPVNTVKTQMRRAKLAISKEFKKS